MGIWDWLGKKPPPLPEGDKPRPHAYEFAHRQLPIFAFRNAATIGAQLADPKADVFLSSIWRVTGKNVAEKGHPALEAQFQRPVRRALPGATLWIVACPPTAVALEAVCVGLLIPDGGGPLRYFTLEVGMRTEPNDPRVHFVCEWQPNGAFASPQMWTHRNHKVTCAPDAFGDCVAKLTSQP